MPVYYMPRTPDVPYPSISFVLSRADGDSMRLPAYREAHLRRYHPYARPPPRQSEYDRDVLMETIDHRYDVPLSIPPLRARQPSVDDVTTEMTNLDIALHGDPSGPSPLVDRCRSLSTLIIDLALAVVRRCQRIYVVKPMPLPAKIDLLEGEAP